MTRSREPVRDALETHFVVPGAAAALCAEPTTSMWEPASGPEVDVTCRQCLVQRRWLATYDELDRDAVLDVVVEPWPAGRRRHVTGDDDPERGRLHRPEHLQLCVACAGLRGPCEGYDNLCRCDRDVWDRHPIPRCGDLSNNAHLCNCCVAVLAPGSSRWTSYYCDGCRPHVFVLNRLAGRCLVPIGPHSIMNGIFQTVPDGPDLDAAVISFHDQLSTMTRNQTALHDLTFERTHLRLADLGIDAYAVGVEDYVTRCRDAGWTARAGFVDFVLSIGEGLDEAAARELWNLPADTGLSPSST
jgi:hypothetical protein